MHRLIHNTSISRFKRGLRTAALLGLSVLIFNGATAVPASAVRPDDIESAIYETTFYDLVPLGACGAAADGENVTLQGKDNIEKGFRYFIAKGLTEIQSAGIIGNLRQESQMDPQRHQNGTKPRQGSGPGRGLAQWTVGERWKHLQQRARAQVLRDNPNLDTPKGVAEVERRSVELSYTLAFQLDFIWYEMNEVAPWKSTLPAIKKTNTIRDAVYAFEDHFEKAGQPEYANRIKYANEVMAAFGGTTDPTTAPATEGNSENAATGNACGATGIAVNGYAFPVAPQTRRDYTNLPCDKGAINYTTRPYGVTTRIKDCHHDGTPAFDLMYNGVGGKSIYSITKGSVVRVDRSYTMNGGPGKPCNALHFKANNGADTSDYWYGHILINSNVKLNTEMEAGALIGRVATQEYGTRCWGGGEHLHIDRGCKDRNGNYQSGGRDACRDPAFLDDLQKIWEGLPAAS